MRPERRSGTRLRLRQRLVAAGLVTGLGSLSAAVLPASVASANPTGVLFAASVAQGTGDCLSPGNACTLTTALADVGPGGTIELVTPGSSAHYVGTFTLSAGTASLPVTIEPASGVSNPILDGNSGNASGCLTTSCLGPVLTIATGVFTTVSGLSIEDGLTNLGGNGGGVDNNGNLTLTNDSVTGNFTGTGVDNGIGNAGSGGGIYNAGTLALTDDTVAGNHTGKGLDVGAATINQGDAPGDSSSVEDFHDGSNGGNGGGIDNAGTLTLTDDTVANNTTGAGGAIGPITVNQGNGTGDTALVDSAANGGNGGNGGGIYNSGSATLADDTVANNTTGAGGSLSSISISQGNGDNDSATIENSDGGANGGNGGGIENTATLTLTNDTVAGNQAGAGGNAGGASLSISQGSGTNDFAEILGNGRSGGSGGQGGDIDNGGTTNVAATIVASGLPGDCSGTALTDQGYNIDSDGSCGLTGTGSVSGSTTLNGSLGSLGFYGGPTQTIPISGPPAVGLVHSASLCASPDQRGVERPSLVCDAGAYENTAAVASITFAKSANVSSYAAPGTLITYSYKATNIGTVTLTSVTVTDGMSGLSPINCGSGSNVVAPLGVGASVTCTATYTTTVADVVAGAVSNTGTATASSPSGTEIVSSPLTILGRPCGSGLTAHFLTATSSAGNFFGIFCVNSAGTGPYTQFSVTPTVIQTASGTGTIKVAGTTTAISATGTKLALLGQKTPTFSSFTETSPPPMRTGTFTLT